MSNVEQNVVMSFGKIVLKTHRATIAALRVRAPFDRVSAIDSSRKLPGTRLVQGCSRNPKVNGCMISDTCIIPDGTFILMQSTWQRGAAFVRQGAVLLRTRSNGPLLNVLARLPTGPESILGDEYSVFRGNADIISAEEARVHRIEIPGNYIRQYFVQAEIDECFEVRELAPERARKPEVSLVATSSGLVVTESVATPVRRLRIRR